MLTRRHPNETSITCAKCRKAVDRVSVERGVFDVMTMETGTRVRVFCHGETGYVMLKRRAALPEAGTAFVPDEAAVVWGSE